MDDMKLNISIDLKGFIEGIKNAAMWAERGKKEISDILNGIKVKADFSGLESELKKVEKEAEKAGNEIAGMSKKADGASSTMGTKFSNLGNIFTGAYFAMDAVRRVYNSTLGNMISEAQEGEKAAKLLESGIKATGNAAGFAADEFASMAGDLQAATNFDGEDIMINVTAILQTFRNLTGETFKTAQSLALDLSTVLGQDLKSSALQLGKALNDPIAGVTALGRAGITFSEDQKGMIKTLMETGNIAQAQQVILTEVANQVGGAAKATADPLVQMKNAWGDIAQNLGQMILPLLKDLASAFIAVSRTLTGANGGINYMQAMFVGLKTIIATVMAKVVELGLVISNYATMICTAIALPFQTLYNVAIGTFNTLSAALKLLMAGDIKGAGDAMAKGITDTFVYATTKAANDMKASLDQLFNDPRYSKMEEKLSNYKSGLVSGGSNSGGILTITPIDSGSGGGGSSASNKDIPTLNTNGDKERYKQLEKSSKEATDNITADITRQVEAYNQGIDAEIAADEAKKAKDKEYEQVRFDFAQKDLELNGNTLQMQLNAIDQFYKDKESLMIAAGMTQEQITAQQEAAKTAIMEAHNKRQNADRNKALTTMGENAKQFGKAGLAVWKAMAIRQTIIDTYASATASYKALAGIPIIGPALATAAATAALMAGMANVREIYNTKMERGGPIRGRKHSQGGEVRELEDGEYVIRESVVSKLGRGFFDMLNFGGIQNAMPVPQLHYASGGLVSGGVENINGLLSKLIARVEVLNMNVANMPSPIVNVINQSEDISSKIERQKRAERNMINRGYYDDTSLQSF